MYPRVQTLVAMQAGRLVEIGRQWHPFGWPRPAWVASHRVSARPLQGDPVEFDAMAWDCINSAWDSKGVWGLYTHDEWSREWPAAPFWVEMQRTLIDLRWKCEPLGPRWRHRTTLDGRPGVLEVTNLVTGHTLRSEATAEECTALDARDALVAGLHTEDRARRADMDRRMAALRELEPPTSRKRSTRGL
jgi:hypothetical protein